MPDGGQCDAYATDDRPAKLELPLRRSRTSELIADVSLIGGVGSRSRYSYRIPDRLACDVRIGHLVQIPFGPRVLQGLVLSVYRGDPGDVRLRDITHLLDPEPCLTGSQVNVAFWIADYYACSLPDALSLMLPAGLDRSTEILYGPTGGEPSSSSRINDYQRVLLSAVQASGPATVARLAVPLDAAKARAGLESLARRGLIVRTYRLGRPTVIDQTETLVVLQPHDPRARLTARQRHVVEFLEGQGGQSLLAELRDELGIDTGTVTRLATRRIVMLRERVTRRDPIAHRHIVPHSAPEFTAEQEAVFQPISEALVRQDGSVFLLHGVTGSGKTEVYLRAVSESLANGRQAIVLVPEIGLTPQAVTRVAGRFPGQVALLHSRLSPGERFDEWQRIRRAQCAVAVGARSAIFSPFANLGLIIIDEEHDASYKQDISPRYHTRDVAEQLAKLTGAVVVLGSATPDVTSFYRADHGEYRLLSMVNRVGTIVASHETHANDASGQEQAEDRPDRAMAPAVLQAIGLPAVQIVDMRLELKAGNRSIFSRALLQALEQTLSRGEQAILFLNRRGNATFVNCRDCGRVVKCRHCDIPMTYHSQGEQLICHRCDDRAPVPSICALCGSWRIRYFGLGTQRVEQEVVRRFPKARAQRYDRDVTGGKFGHELILDRFAAGDIDVLVGTQIVAKGLDFPRVTIVGAISADTSINLPDFRAAERTFSLLTQVAGRAGRAGLPGSVVIQTYTPGHFAIQAAALHDYHAFYRDEIRYRQEGLYPPFSQLARLMRSERVDNICRQEAYSLADDLSAWIAAHPDLGIDLIGPAPCFINKAQDRFYWQILLRGPDVHPILAHVRRGWAIDVDPMNLL